jgi:hypothetical protein
MAKVKSATRARPVAAPKSQAARQAQAGRQSLAARQGRAQDSSQRWARVATIVVIALLGLGAAFWIGTVVAGPSATDRLVAKYEQEEKDRDKVQIGKLNELAKGAQQRLAPVVSGMAAVFPVNAASPARAPKPEEVKKWGEVLAAEVDRYKSPPSGGNGVNVTQIALNTGVKQLAAAADAFDLAMTASGLDRPRLLRLAGEQRTLALHTWSAASIQLDVINIDAGNGHVHADLTSESSDGVAEGTGAR